MGIESVNGIWDLNKLWPLSSDDRTTSDDHHRVIKKAVVQTLPNLSATVVASHAELNQLTGIERNVLTYFNTVSASLAQAESDITNLQSRTTTLEASVSALSTDVNTLSAAVGNSYSMIVNSDGSALSLPNGWTSSRSASGVYRVTHGLGNGNLGVLLINTIEFGTGGHPLTVGSTHFKYIVQRASATYADVSCYIMFDVPVNNTV